MSSRLNLNDNTKDRFEFSIGGLDYDLRYPTMEDLEPISQLNVERDALSKEDTPESVRKIADLDKEAQQAMYNLIEPVGHTTPIQDTLKKQPFPVVKAFNDMVSAQLNAE